MFYLNYGGILFSIYPIIILLISTGGVLEGESFLGIPPLGILLSQELLEKDKLVNKATPVSLKSDLLGVTAKVTRENLTMAAFRISTRMDSPFAGMPYFIYH